MPVQVARQTRPGSTPEIEADIVAIGVHQPIERPDHAPQRFHRFQQFVGVERVLAGITTLREVNKVTFVE